MTQVTFTLRGHMVRTHEVTNKEHLASQVKNTMKNTDEEHKVYLAFNMHNKQKKNLTRHYIYW